jgi:Tol biopolymer transport system component
VRISTAVLTLVAIHGADLTPSVAQAPATPPARRSGLPFVSLDGQRIAFVGARGGAATEVFVINRDGSGERQLTASGGRKGAARWVAAGTALIYEAVADTTTVYRINLGDGAQRPWHVVVGREVVPSPDGKRVLFSAGPFRTARLTVANADMSEPRVIGESPPFIFNAAWSPDGRRIAFATVDSSRRLQVGVMMADGTGKRLYPGIAAAEGSSQWPAWSPDGRRLAVQVGKYQQKDPASNTAHIWIIDVETGAASKLAPHDRPYLDETPSWFPDGRQIAFQSDRTGRMEVWVMTADGTDARQVTK